MDEIQQKKKGLPGLCNPIHANRIRELSKLSRAEPSALQRARNAVRFAYEHLMKLRESFSPLTELTREQSAALRVAADFYETAEARLAFVLGIGNPAQRKVEPKTKKQPVRSPLPNIERTAPKPNC